jgi:hypothetical protein
VTDPQTAFLVSAGYGVDDSTYADAVAKFEQAGVPVVLENRDQEFFAALQYLALILAL